MNIRLIAATASVLAAGTLAVVTTPSLGQAADGGAAPVQLSGEPRIRGTEAARAATDSCVGGVQKQSFTGGDSGWFSTTGSDVVPGTTFQFYGPGSGKDTVYVDLSAFDVYADSGEYGRARVTLDGVDMAPSDENYEYFDSGDNYRSVAGQYCAKVGSGLHKVRIRLESTYGAYVYLYNPMLHVEVAD